MSEEKPKYVRKKCEHNKQKIIVSKHTELGFKNLAHLPYKYIAAMSDSAFFKVKSSKRSNPEARTTLDAIHNQKIQQINDEKNNIDLYHSEAEAIKTKIKNSTSDIEIWRLERELETLEKKIKSLQSDNDLMDYYLRTGDILFNYYDIQEQIQQGAKTFATNKAKPGSILAILEEVASDEATCLPAVSTSVNILNDTNATATAPKEKMHQRHNLLNEYLQLEDPTMAKNTIEEYDDPWTQCEHCGNEMIMCLNEANLTCSKCGHQEFILVDSDKPSYKDPPREVCYYAYKKINHFNEWLAQFQAKESTEIPNEVYDEILVQLKKERITNMSSLKPTKLREILRKMKCSKYYEHIPHIINRLNGQNAPFMSREDEEKLRHMFREIQPSFKKHCPKGRRNFLSYGYVLYKFCELLEMDEYLACFPLLKNRDKLYLQDKTWQRICEDMGWQYIRTC